MIHHLKALGGLTRVGRIGGHGPHLTGNGRQHIRFTLLGFNGAWMPTLPKLSKDGWLHRSRIRFHTDECRTLADGVNFAIQFMFKQVAMQQAYAQIRYLICLIVKGVSQSASLRLVTMEATISGPRNRIERPGQWVRCTAAQSLGQRLVQPGPATAIAGPQ